MITWDDVIAARARIAPYLSPTPLRSYAPLDAELGAGIRVLVKHENHLPTNAFKARNAMSLMTALSADQRARGVIAATRGNHGAGLAWAGQTLGVPVVICVPRRQQSREERRDGRVRRRARSRSAATTTRPLSTRRGSPASAGCTSPTRRTIAT